MGKVIDNFLEPTVSATALLYSASAADRAAARVALRATAVGKFLCYDRLTLNDVLDRLDYEDDNPWQQFQGAAGGRGWKNSKTGEVRYQQERPGTHSSKEEDSGSNGPSEAQAKEQRIGNALKGLMSRGFTKPEARELLAKLAGAGAFSQDGFVTNRDVAAKIVQDHLEKKSKTNQPPQQPQVEPANEPSPQEKMRRRLLSVVSRNIDRSKIPDEIKKQYLKAAKEAFDNMPTKALERIYTNIRSYTFYPSMYAMTKAECPNYNSVLIAAGLWISNTGTVACAENSKRDVGYKARAGTLTHEITHGIDGPDYTYSRTLWWREVWQKEIVGKRGHVTLSKYAKTEPVEGFAEFGRCLYDTGTPLEAIEERLPLCSQYWKHIGLWPEKKVMYEHDKPRGLPEQIVKPRKKRTPPRGVV